MSKRLAFITTAMDSADISHFVLPFDDDRRTFAQGRVLVVAVPALKSANGPFGLLQPTTIEQRQLHKLGMHLLEAAFEGNRLTAGIDPIADIWAHPDPYQNLGKAPLEIAVPTVFTLKKLSSGHWVPGYFSNYLAESGAKDVIETSLKSDLQQAANWLFSTINHTPASLAHAPKITVMRQFPDIRYLRTKLTATAKKRRGQQHEYAMRTIEQKMARRDHRSAGKLHA